MAQYWAEILTIFGSYFGRNDDFIDSFWNLLTFSDLNFFSNFRSAFSPKFKSFSRSLEHFFLTVGQINFGNKIPFPWVWPFQIFDVSFRFKCQLLRIKQSYLILNWILIWTSYKLMKVFCNWFLFGWYVWTKNDRIMMKETGFSLKFLAKYVNY